MLITERYQKQIVGIISCYDRVIIQGSLSQWGYAEGMTSFLFSNKIKIFDYPAFAQTLRDELDKQISEILKENNMQIEYIRKPSAFSKDERVQKIISERNITEGLIVIFSVLEQCIQYKPSVDKIKHHYFVRPKQGICLHYYIYFIDREYGLCFLRIPTYAPFRLEFYFNGHNLLANKLKKNNIGYKMISNAFLNIDDLLEGQSGFQRAQDLSDNLRVEDLREFLDILSEKYLPFLKQYNQSYRWSIAQAEYSTDIIFKNQEDFQIFYQDLIHKVILSVKPDNISTFLGKKLVSCYQGETGNNFINTRILGTRIKHRKGSNQIKLYDKLGIILRIETTVNNVTDFNHYRKIISKDGKERFGDAKMKKSIYSLYALGEILKNANHRYLEFISEIEDNSQGVKKLSKVSDPVFSNDRSLKGFNFFDEFDLKLLQVISRGEFLINGFRNKDIRMFFESFSSSSISRILKRLLLHHIIKKVRNSYKYYITKFGKAIIVTASGIKEFYILPKLSMV